MFFYKAAFGICLVLLLVSYAALASAQKKGDQRQVRVIHFLRAGLTLSAVSYLLRLMQPAQAGHSSPAAFVTCLMGTLFIWLGWLEHWRMRGEGLRSSATPRDAEAGDEAEGAAAGALPGGANWPGLPNLNARVHLVLRHAQDEARRRGQCCMDTEHLLLGLLREPHSAGVCILERLGVKAEKVHIELLGRMGPRQKFMGRAPVNTEMGAKATSLRLTDRAHQVLDCAAGEAHRFDQASIGTEHLLLGLVLIGKGEAAATLFGEGVTVDSIREEIMKAKRLPARDKGL